MAPPIASQMTSLDTSLVAQSLAMKHVLEMADRVAAKDVPVLITGESGTGKEVLARRIVAKSRRSTRPLVTCNCGAIPEGLTESLLFGHARGAFSGAASRHDGYFAAADGGTLMLDEVGDLPLSAQVKLLRAAQSGEIQPVGQNGSVRVNVRVIACTNTNLRKATARGTFRADLYFRLAVVELEIPPLRERREDIGPLASLFAHRFAESFDLDEPTLPHGLTRKLEAWDWPGNVRQLEGFIARLGALADRSFFRVDWDGELERLRVSSAELSPAAPSGAGSALRSQVDQIEVACIKDALTRNRGNLAASARDLGLPRTTLIDKLARHGLWAGRPGKRAAML